MIEKILSNVMKAAARLAKGGGNPNHDERGRFSSGLGSGFKPGPRDGPYKPSLAAERGRLMHGGPRILTGKPSREEQASIDAAEREREAEDALDREREAHRK